MKKEITNEELVAEEVVKPVAIKKLTKAELTKQNKQLDEQREFAIKIGDTEYKLSHDVVFRKTKKHKLLDDIISFFNEGVRNLDVLDVATPYTALLVIKHFTSLEVSDDVDEALALLEVLVDLEILDKIVNELPEKEVVNIYELITATVNNIKETLEEADNETENLLEQVENNEVKELITNGVKE